MMTAIAHYAAAADAADAVRQLLARHAAASRAEPGRLQIDSRRSDLNRMTVQYAVPHDPERFDNR
jgi:quinol monooxygenase YgiN